MGEIYTGFGMVLRNLRVSFLHRTPYTFCSVDPSRRFAVHSSERRSASDEELTEEAKTACRLVHGTHKVAAAALAAFLPRLRLDWVTQRISLHSLDVLAAAVRRRNERERRNQPMHRNVLSLHTCFSLQSSGRGIR